MKTLWKGAISFGLVNIPVNMYVATENKDIRFNYLHKECLSPIRYQKYCPHCDKEIDGSDIVRGYEYQKGSYVVIDEEDLESIPQENTKTIDILDFVTLSQVDPVFFDKSYYLEPSPGGEKAYALIIEAMKKTDKIAIARVIIRSRQSLAALRTKEEILIMETIFYPDEIRSSELLNHGLNPSKLHEKEIKMAINLIENLSVDFDPAKYEDEYRKALGEMIAAKVAGEEVVTSQQPPEARGNVVDLMEALQASVKLAEEQRKEKRPAPSSKRKSKTGS
ncbi:Predicted Ku, prokaryotic type [Syntrophomonas zehnderi OL-4]|uniref:Non-homologous end joining protein Ku n=1 Tax=Syntrophomonas zehnderi OL-4 TaxID=690567 RepID=A0A0E3W3W4_9FIRM|nr:Ku protein [Syntrophomonas zehnderi]CFY09276.1 Predicted Ku, prokaryotic type [Syntrophomonas zehnderi OL-4]